MEKLGKIVAVLINQAAYSYIYMMTHLSVIVLPAKQKKERI